MINYKKLKFNPSLKKFNTQRVKQTEKISAKYPRYLEGSPSPACFQAR